MYIHALVTARFRVQYDKYFPSFSYFAVQQNMRNEENIGYIMRDKRAYRYHEKYLLSVTVIQHLSRINYHNSTFIKKHNNKFLSPSNH